MVGAPGRVGYRISMAPPLVLAGMVPPPDVMRRLPTDTALYIVLTTLGYRTPGYRLGKMLAQQRRVVEGIWTRSKR